MSVKFLVQGNYGLALMEFEPTKPEILISLKLFTFKAITIFDKLTLESGENLVFLHLFRKRQAVIFTPS
jgi:hypothetical protein